MLAPHHQEPDHESLKTEISYMPGGKWILPHYEEGPYHLVLVTKAYKDIDRRAGAALEAYPGILTTKCWDGFDSYEPATIHVVPDFVNDLLHWHQAEDELLLNEDITLPSYAAVPTENDIATDALPGMLNHPNDADLTDALCDAQEEVGLASVLTLLGGLDEAVLADATAITSAVRGVLTTSSAAR